jgi:ATP-binding protein involved in chromosome partitioning
VSQVNVQMTAQVRSDARSRPMIPGVQHVIAVASGKGGVGKSTVSANLAVALAQAGARVGLLDADIYGPSLPRMMGISREPIVRNVDGEPKMLPIAAHGVQVMSLGFILREDQAVVWRGPMLGKAVADMLSGVVWGEQDYLVVDLPPGTGDVPMSLAQMVPISGVVVVTTPQQVAQDIARKSILMFQTLEQGLNKSLPILGLVENMSGGIFGTGGGEQTAQRFGVPFLGRVPLDSVITEGGDSGRPAVLAYPATGQAASFREIAQKLAARISTLQYGVSKNG